MNKSITAVIPTRSGSERVKNKNTKMFANTTLLEIKIKLLKQLLQNKLIDDIVINSNCETSLELANKHNVTYVKRGEHYASSECDIRDYWVNVGENVNTDNFMLCQVTSPLISYDTYVTCINKFNCDNSILTVTKVNDYIWEGNCPINYKLPEHPKSQDLPDNFFKLNFGVCIMSVIDIKHWKNLITPKTVFIYLSNKESIDIDNEIDFKLAEIIYNDEHN